MADNLFQLPSYGMLPLRQMLSPKAVEYQQGNRYLISFYIFAYDQTSLQIIIDIDICMSRLLTEPTRLAQLGKINEAIQALDREQEKQGESYATYCNLAALNLQLNKIQESLDFNAKAISLDPYAYVAYYNRFLVFLSQGKNMLAWADLQKALSCLYLIKGIEQSSMKFLGKSISFCQNNAKAYLVRARLNQGKHNKIAENDYSTALQIAPNMTEIYQHRALFYRRLGKAEQFQKDLQTYLSLKALRAHHSSQLSDNRNNSQTNLRQKIDNGVKQFHELLSKTKQKEEQDDVVSKLPLDCIHSTIEKKDDEELLLSDRPQLDTEKTIQIRKQKINFKKRAYQERLEKNFEQIFQDQNSKDLNDQIEKLQNQIKKDGGKLSLQQNEIDLDQSDPSNFLTDEIQKAIEEIAKLGNKDSLNEVRSVRSAKSNQSARSKTSDRELSVEQFKKYDCVKLKVLNIEDIENYERKDLAKVVIHYRYHQFETKNEKFSWNQEFTFVIDPDTHEVEIEVMTKGTVFTQSYCFGSGFINLLDYKQSKCILGNKDKKTAILHYKIAFQ